MRPWRLAELTYAEVKQRGYEVAVIPLGCTEPHNLHLPYGTDTLEAEIIGDHICESACDAGAKVVLLPTIPYGTVTNQRECPLSINVNPSTLFAFLRSFFSTVTAETNSNRSCASCTGRGRRTSSCATGMSVFATYTGRFLTS